MRIFIFKSEVAARLRDFAGDLDGSKLPAQFRPLRAFGSIAPDRDPPASTALFPKVAGLKYTADPPPRSLRIANRGHELRCKGMTAQTTSRLADARYEPTHNLPVRITAG
jgi:hypothetical protein